MYNTNNNRRLMGSVEAIRLTTFNGSQAKQYEYLKKNETALARLLKRTVPRNVVA